MIINSNNAVSNQITLTRPPKEKDINQDLVTKGTTGTDPEIAKSDNLKKMNRSTIGENIGEFVSGIVSGVSAPGTIGAVLGTAALAGGCVLLGAPALVACGAGAVGFVAGGMAGLVYDLKHHLFS